MSNTICSQYPNDRFIPRRDSQNFDVSEYLLNPRKLGNIDARNMFNTKNSRYVNLAYEHFKCKEFEKLLWRTLIDKPKRVLNLSGMKHKKRDNKNPFNNIWPVKPRTKFGINSPLVILDVPGVSGNLTHNLLDWSVKGQLASVHDGTIYIWSSHKDLTFIVNNICEDFEHCIKWNRKGTLFAVSMIGGRISVWSIIVTKKLSERKCCSKYRKCHINCIEWSQDDKCIITGCSNRYLRVWSSDLLRIASTIDQAEIVKIVMSPNNNYFATSNMGGYLQFLSWPSLKHKFKLEITTTARAVVFHPMRESLIAVGDQMGEVTIFNINTHKAIGQNYLENASCDAIAWNNITGELVVSYYIQPVGSESNPTNEIIVYSNMQTITDRINWHFCRVPYLLWGNGGTQLATAGTSEELCVWNFIGSNRKKYPPSVLCESFTKIR